MKRTQASSADANERPPQSPRSSNVALGLLEVLVGLLGAIAEERDRRQVLQRPRLTPPVAQATVDLERLTAVGVGAVHVTREHRGAAAGPQRRREAVLVADAPPQLERLVDGPERPRVVALHLLDLGEVRHGAGAVARLRRRLLEDVLEVDGRRREVAVLGVRLRPSELDAPAVLVVEVGWEQPDALVVEPYRAAPQLRGGRAARGDLEHLERPLAEVVGDALDRPELGDELGDGAVVVRSALGVRTVGSAGVLAEPLGERRVASRPLGLREGAVRDRAHDLRRKAELTVVERDELAPVERDERILDVDHVAAPVDERPDRVDAARGADDRAVLEHRALDRTERVEPGGDEPAQRRRQLAGLQRRLGCFGTTLSQQCGELLDEERVAARALAQERDELRIDIGPEELARERGDRVRVEWVEVEHREVVPTLRRAPSLEQLWTRRREEREGECAHPLDQSEEHFEHDVVGPVEVGNGDDERPRRARSRSAAAGPRARRPRGRAPARRRSWPRRARGGRGAHVSSGRPRLRRRGGRSRRSHARPRRARSPVSRRGGCRSSSG